MDSRYGWLAETKGTGVHMALLVMVPYILRGDVCDWVAGLLGVPVVQGGPILPAIAWGMRSSSPAVNTVNGNLFFNGYIFPTKYISGAFLNDFTASTLSQAVIDFTTFSDSIF